MKAVTKILRIADLDHNRGQVAGVHENPRYCTKEQRDMMRKSIEDNPEMLSLRELLVFPYDGKEGARYMVIGGNMRLDALRELGYEETVCKVMPEDTPVDVLNARIIKDNAPFGEWDYDMLANEWDVDELGEYGLDVSGWKVSEQDFEDAGQEIDVDSFDEEMKLKIKLTEEQMDYVRRRLAEINSSPEMALLIALGWDEEYES